MYRLGVQIVRGLPRPFSRFCARRIADLNYLWLTGARRTVRDNLGPVVGAGGRVLRRTTLRLFRNYADVLVDFAVIFGGASVSVRELFSEAQGYEHLETAVRRGRGVILLTAHLGFWELGGLYFNQSRLPVHILTVRDPDPGVDEERIRIREALGIRTITVGADPWNSLRVAKALREGAIVGTAVDRYRGPDAVSVPLFGRPMPFSPAPVLYARMTGAAVIPGFVVADGRAKYKGVVLPPVTMEFSVDRAADVARNLARVAGSVESVIRDYPDQWYNFEPVWG